MATPAQMRLLGLTRRKYAFNETLDSLLRQTYTEARSMPELSRGLDALQRMRDWPRWAWFMRAAELGLTQQRARAWTEAEDRTILMMAGTYSCGQIARKLKGRTYKAVRMRAFKLQIRTQLREGYTQKTIARCFGVSHQKVERWVAMGLLGRRQERFGEEQIRRFMKYHPEEYDLRRVDQVWFVSMAFGRNE